MQIDFVAILAGLAFTIIILIVLVFVIQGIALGFALGAVNGKNRELGSTFVTALFSALVIWIPILGCILSWYFIKNRHDVGWGGAIVAWLLSGFIAVIIVIALMFAGVLGGLALIPFI